MAIQILYRTQAFGPGDELWIIPPDRENPLLTRMDWYLNFQLRRSQTHRPEEWTPQIKSILKENQLPDFHFSSAEKKPLMIPASNYFPAKFIVELPLPEDKSSWMKRVEAVWSGLKRPALRVFLPSHMTADEFKSAWDGPKNEDVTIVPS